MSQYSVINRRDLEFLLVEWLRLEDLLRERRFSKHDVESVLSTLNVAQSLAEQRLAPHLRASDLQEPALRGNDVSVLPAVRLAVREMAETGLFGAAFDESDGGSQLPYVAFIAAMGLLMSGSIAAASFMLLTVANARLIMESGSALLKCTFAAPQIAGKALGTMCLSEPHAGSSLADIRTRAVPDGEDAFGRRFRLFGQKMWISAGDHDVTDQIIHLVLAKIPDSNGKLSSGNKNISLFVVPKKLPDGARNDVKVASLNHKMGYRALPNCALNFGEGGDLAHTRPGAVGWLIGEAGDGLAQMFRMMNEARIAVGLGGTMLAYRGYLMSLDYARQRTQGRHPDSPAGAPVLIAEHADVKRMLLAQKSYAEGALALVLYSAKLLDLAQVSSDESVRHASEELLSLLTPVSKTWPSEWAQRSLDLGLQVHGGAGYCRDFEIELLYRDNRLNPIHEGTTGIQAIDLVRRKLRRQQSAGLEELLARVTASSAAAREHAELHESADALLSAWRTLTDIISGLREIESDELAISHATPFLFAFGHAVVGWLWLDQATHCAVALRNGRLNNADRNFRLGKLRACRFFFEYEMPRITAWLNPIRIASRVSATMPLEQFLGEMT